MQDLFSSQEAALSPLADRMRPRTLDEFIGQGHIVGPGRLLRRAIEADRMTSSIFYGPPGCGKTTLLKAAAGLLLPQAGVVRFTSPNASGRTHPKVAMVFQEPLLLPWKTVRENAALALSARTGEALSEACKSAAVTQALTLAGIADLAERFPAELSGGQQQRAGLARALSAEPDVLLMDEPFGALDALTRLELQDETRALFNRRRMTVLMITHDVREALRMADRAVVLRGGSAAADHSLLMPFPRRFSDPAVGAAEDGLLAELLHH